MLTPEEEAERVARKEKYKTGCECDCHKTDDCECYSHAPCMSCTADLPGLCRASCQKCELPGSLDDGSLFWYESTGVMLCRGCRPAKPSQPTIAQIDEELSHRQLWNDTQRLKR